MEAGKRIIVPWDFTEKADNALAHAVKMAKVLDNTITLLHIVKKDKEIEEASAKLNDIAALSIEKFGVPINTVVKEGSIFTTIGEYTKEC